MVLVVDDEALILILAESFFQEMGYQTITASGRDEAIAALKDDNPIDLLFTDINMKDENGAGFELAKEAVKLRPGLPVIYATGYTDWKKSEFVDRHMVVIKPYNIEDIRKAVQNLLH